MKFPSLSLRPIITVIDEPAEHTLDEKVALLIDAADRIAAQGGVTGQGLHYVMFEAWSRAGHVHWTELGVLAGGILPVTPHLITQTLLRMRQRAFKEMS